MVLQDKVDTLKGILSDFGRVGIAFSGGADSSFLLKSALDTLGGDNVVILHAHSCLLKKEEQQCAQTWLCRHGYPAEIELVSVVLQPLSRREFVRNDADRCYRCKHHIYSLFLEELTRRGIDILLDGTNCDDIKKDRPGLRAIQELGVQIPLVSSGLTKKEIREVSRNVKLDTSDLPSASCLATRIPFGLEITAQRLEQIESWEKGITGMGFDGCRVRMDIRSGEIVYLQLLFSDLDKFFDPKTRLDVVRFFNKTGVEQVFLDLEGR